jgi:hypothetical protein
MYNIVEEALRLHGVGGGGGSSISPNKISTVFLDGNAVAVGDFLTPMKEQSGITDATNLNYRVKNVHALETPPDPSIVVADATPYATIGLNGDRLAIIDGGNGAVYLCCKVPHSNEYVITDILYCNIECGNPRYNQIVSPDGETIIIGSENNSGSGTFYIYIRVIKTIGGKMTSTTQYTVGSGTSYTALWGLCVLDATHVVIHYSLSSVYMRVYTLSSTKDSLTAGTQYTYSVNIQQQSFITEIDATHFAILYAPDTSGTYFVKVFNVSGTTITANAGAAVAISETMDNAYVLTNPYNSYANSRIYFLRQNYPNGNEYGFSFVFMWNGSSYIAYEDMYVYKYHSYKLDTTSQYLYIGSSDTWTEMYYILDDLGEGYTLQWEYWNGTAWTVFTPSFNVMIGNLDNYVQGRVTIPTLSGWTTKAFSSTFPHTATPPSTSAKYWVRLKTTTTPTKAVKFLKVTQVQHSTTTLHAIKIASGVVNPTCVTSETMYTEGAVLTGGDEGLTARILDINNILLVNKEGGSEEWYANIFNINPDYDSLSMISRSKLGIRGGKIIDWGSSICGVADSFKFKFVWHDVRADITKSTQIYIGDLVMDAIGMAIESVSDGQFVKVQEKGIVKNITKYNSSLYRVIYAHHSFVSSNDTGVPLGVVLPNNQVLLLKSLLDDEENYYSGDVIITGVSIVGWEKNKIVSCNRTASQLVGGFSADDLILGLAIDSSSILVQGIYKTTNVLVGSPYYLDSDGKLSLDPYGKVVGYGISPIEIFVPKMIFKGGKM